MHSSTTAIEFVALVVRPRHVAALTDVTQRAPIVVAFGKRARFVELGVCQYHQRFSGSTYRDAGVGHRIINVSPIRPTAMLAYGTARLQANFRVCSHSTRLIHQ